MLVEVGDGFMVEDLVEVLFGLCEKFDLDE